MKSQERIEKFIFGQLSHEETLLFKAELLSNPPLKEEYNSIKSTIEALQSMWLREEVMDAQFSWKLRRTLTKIGIAILGTAVFLFFAVKSIKSSKTTSDKPKQAQFLPLNNAVTTDSVFQENNKNKQVIFTTQKPKETQFLSDTNAVFNFTESNQNAVRSNENADSVFTPEVYTYFIDNKRDNFIQSPSGLRIFIPAKSLVNPCNNNPVGEVKIELEDYSDYYSIYKHKVTTISGNHLLESGGSCFIRASSETDELKINPEKKIYLLFPTDSKEPKMQTFYGYRTETGSLEWNAAPTQSLLPANGGSNNANADFYYFQNLLYFPNDLKPSKEIQGILNNYLNQFNQLNIKIKKELLEDSLKLQLTYKISENGDLKGFDYIKHIKGENPNKIFKPNLWKRYDRRIMKFGRQMGNLTVPMNDGSLNPNDIIEVKLIPRYKTYSSSDSLEIIDSSDNIATKLMKENVNYNIITARAFGYINCDYFKEGNLIDIEVPVKNDEEVRIFFNQFTAAAILQNSGSTATFNNLPKGEPVKMISIRREEGNATMSLTQSTISSRMHPGPFEPYSLEKIKRFLEAEPPKEMP